MHSVLKACCFQGVWLLILVLYLQITCYVINLQIESMGFRKKRLVKYYCLSASVFDSGNAIR